MTVVGQRRARITLSSDSSFIFTLYYQGTLFKMTFLLCLTLLCLCGLTFSYECYSQCVCLTDMKLVSCTGQRLVRSPTFNNQVNTVFSMLDLRRNNIKHINLLDVRDFDEVDLRFNPLDCRNGILNRGIVRTVILTDCPTVLVEKQTNEKTQGIFHEKLLCLVFA